MGKPLTHKPASGEKSWQRLLLEQITADWQWDHAQLSHLDRRRLTQRHRGIEDAEQGEHHECQCRHGAHAKQGTTPGDAITNRSGHHVTSKKLIQPRSTNSV